MTKIRRLSGAAMLAAAFAALCVAAFLNSPAAMASAYLMPVAGAALVSAVSAIAAERSLSMRPPQQVLGWAFLHFAVFALVFAFEEAGWYLWRQAALADPGAAFASSGFLRVFEFKISPILKALLACAGAGLLSVVAMASVNASTCLYRSRLVAVWTVSLAACAALLALA